MAPTATSTQNGHPKGPQPTPDHKTTGQISDDSIHHSVLKLSSEGHAALRDVFSNQDTAFEPERRDQHGLRGLLPPAYQNLATQIQRSLLQLRSKKEPLEKYIYLSSLRQTNTRLFYAVIMSEPEEACVNWSHIYRRPEGLTITLEDKGRVAEIVDNWPVPSGSPRIAVMTDGSRILGLGDLGWDGQGISLGKCSLYVSVGGLHPRSTIPIVVDLGTDNQEKLDDPLYLGLRQKRASNEVYREFMDEVMVALNKKFPNLIIQFEDFSTERAFDFLERYKNKFPMFNDDIQGTGSVVLGGFVSAARVASQASGKPLSDQRILFFGAGSAGVGVGKQLLAFFRKQGMSEDEARRRIWLVDSKGLVTNDRGDKLPEHKIYFSRDDNQGKQYKDLLQVIDYVKPTALIGLSTVPNTFTPEVLNRMAELNERPVIFPLSNPAKLAECTHEDAIKHTKGKAIFAAGSPFPDVEYEGKRFIAGQANNMYIFPSIGLGAAVTKSSRVTDSMVDAASFGLAGCLTEEEKAEGRIYPSLTRIREVARDVATAVIKKANEEGVTRDGGYTQSFTDEDLTSWVEGEMWVPEYQK
ncbi:unnamed protein product [Sympodiomycopsis kandeliae]